MTKRQRRQERKTGDHAKRDHDQVRNVGAGRPPLFEYKQQRKPEQSRNGRAGTRQEGWIEFLYGYTRGRQRPTEDENSQQPVDYASRSLGQQMLPHCASVSAAPTSRTR